QQLRLKATTDRAGHRLESKSSSNSPWEEAYAFSTFSDLGTTTRLISESHQRKGQCERAHPYPPPHGRCQVDSSSAASEAARQFRSLAARRAAQLCFLLYIDVISR